MFTAYIIVTVLAAAANTYAATNDFMRAEMVLAGSLVLGLASA